MNLPNASKVKVSRVLHAGYIFSDDQTQILFDPIFENPFSRNCHAFPEIEFDIEQIKKQKFSAVFISHYHDDHCSFESLNLLDRATPIYMFCVFEQMFDLIRELGFINVYSLQLDVTLSIGGFQVTPRRALDEDVDSIFHIQAGDLNILNVVDSWIDDQTMELLAQYSPWDLVLWPFQTMREIEVIAPSRAKPAQNTLPPEWISQLKILNPKFLVPSSCQFIQESWSWYNNAFFPISYQQFETEIQGALPYVTVVRLNPSVSVQLSENRLQYSEPVPWIKPVGLQNLDYHYKKNIKPPHTSEISKNFAALSDAQSALVFSYLKSGLIDKYESMEAPLDSYFEKSRSWKLSIYDHVGDAISVFYQVKENKMIHLAEEPKTIGWLTEIPISKIYAALKLGESLTSMYVRINNIIFDQEIEKEIEDVDVIDDPLIRCLFTGVFGAYQKAQLQCIRSRSQSRDRLKTLLNDN
ncbi:MAG: MBL fold metallo-hydrolase [Bdellovibrio sp.]|nr:MBL fold metallo-hydrolase [Bdellovibrio sp.]